MPARGIAYRARANSHTVGLTMSRPPVTPTATADAGQPAPGDTCPDKETARAVYPVAVELRLEASRGVFGRLNILLLSNSIILLAVVATLTVEQPLFDLAAYLSLFGLLVCGVWLVRIRDARQRIIDYGNVIIKLENCLDVKIFDPIQADHEKRREWWLSQKLKHTKIGKIGAAEYTIVPLMILYLYLAVVALKRVMGDG